MSATLTTKRKSARDRPASSNERVGELGERKREIDRGARGQMARARSGSDSRSPEGSAGPSCLAGPARSCLVSPLHATCETVRHACRRRRPRALAQPRCCCRPRRRAVVATPLSAALSPAQSTSGAAPNAAPMVAGSHQPGTCVARAHACVRYGAWAGCGAHSESTSSIALPPHRQPLLSGHKND